MTQIFEDAPTRTPAESKLAEFLAWMEHSAGKAWRHAQINPKQSHGILKALAKPNTIIAAPGIPAARQISQETRLQVAGLPRLLFRMGPDGERIPAADPILLEADLIVLTQAERLARDLAADLLAVGTPILFLCENAPALGSFLDGRPPDFRSHDRIPAVQLIGITAYLTARVGPHGTEIVCVRDHPAAGLKAGTVFRAS